MSDPALHILAEAVHKIFPLPEGDCEHEFSLRVVLERECGEEEAFELARVEEVDDLPSVHGVACKPVGMPRKDAVRFTPFQHVQHSCELGSAGLLRGFCFAQRSHDFELFPCGKFAKFRKLRVNGESLSLFGFRRFPSVDDDFHGDTVAEEAEKLGRRAKENALRLQAKRGWRIAQNRAAFSGWCSLLDAIRTDLSS